MESKIEVKTLVISIALILVVYTLFSVINMIINKKVELKRLKTPFVFILIAVSAKLFFQLNNGILTDMKYVNAFFYMIVIFGSIRIFDYFINTAYKDKFYLNAPKLVHDIVLSVVYMITFFLVLKIEMGVDLAPLFATSAVVSMVIGFALQDTLTNFIAGVVIHIERPFKIGDWVLVNSVEGKVVEINWRTVKVLTFNNDFLVIPNSNIMKDSIMNYNYPTSKHIMSIFIGTSYDDAPNKVKKVLGSVLKNNPRVLELPRPEVWVVNYNDFSIDYEVRMWIDDFGKKKVIENELMTNIWYAFKREGIKIPFPIRDVHHHHSERITEIEKEKKEIEEKAIILREVEFFNDFSKDIIDKLAEKAKKIIYAKAETLFRQGDEGESFFIINKGQVLVTINAKEVATLDKGFIGEMSLFTGKRRTATVKALSDSEFLVLDKDGFSDIIMQNEDIAEKISEIIVKREIQNENMKKAYKNKAISRAKQKEMERIKKDTMLNKIKNFFNI